jgi:predicted nucleic acid-binding protein
VRWLLDTVVLSELRKQRRNPHLVAWIKSVPETDLHLSVVTIAEVECGIERQRVANPAFATELAAWIDVVVRTYGDHILPVTTAIAERWGRLAAPGAGLDMDLAIAATALEHGLAVATRNVGDFVATGVPTFDPFAPPAR